MKKLYILMGCFLVFALSTQGQSIQIQSFGAVDMQYFKAKMVDEQLGYMLLPRPNDTAENRVLFTLDGGNNWQNLSLPSYIPPVNNYRLAVHFVNASKVILVIHDRVYYSNNAGAQWDLSITQPNNFLEACFDGNNGMLADSYTGQVWFTNTGGQNWQLHNFGFTSQIPIGCVCKGDKGFLWYANNFNSQPFIQLNFNPISWQISQRQQMGETLYPNSTLSPSFMAISEDDWFEGMFNYRRTTDGGLTFSAVTPYLPLLTSGLTLENRYQLFYHLPDTAFVVSDLNNLFFQEQVYRLPDSLKSIAGLAFGSRNKQFFVATAASAPLGGTNYVVEDMKLVSRQGILLAQQAQSLEKVQIYPNPTQDRLFIGGIEEDGWAYAITDLSGRSIQSGKLEMNSAPVNSLQPGVYFITLTHGRNSSVFRFIKQ